MTSKPVHFTPHARLQMIDRGAIEADVLATIADGESSPAKHGRLSLRKNFPFEAVWKGRYYGTKQVLAIVREEADRLVIITVYVFYFGGER